MNSKYDLLFILSIINYIITGLASVQLHQPIIKVHKIVEAKHQLPHQFINNKIIIHSKLKIT